MRDANAQRIASIQHYLSKLRERPTPVVEGKLSRVVGLTLEAVGCRAAIGDRCRVRNRGGNAIDAEVVGFAGDSLYLMPVQEIRGLAPGSSVIPVGASARIPVGDELLGRVVDATGKPLDDGGAIAASATRAVDGEVINPLARAVISETLDVGVRSINALLAVGRGQRLGLFAPSGVGKSMLMGMMTRFTDADVIVVGLVGERGREVKEFVDRILGAAGMSRSVVVATPADTSPLMRMRGAATATAIAEHFRDQGRHVLLLIDSLTRFAQAHREIALTIGEPPATRGYPPSVFARLAQLVERAGPGANGNGSITAFYTVLTDAVEQNDPLAEAARAILDGHVVLSRAVAERGLYPAIDVESSVSRVMHQVVSDEHATMARRFRELFAAYEQNSDLFAVGAYQRGADALLDAAVALRPAMLDFMRQDVSERVSCADATAALAALLAGSTSTTTGSAGAMAAADVG